MIMALMRREAAWRNVMSRYLEIPVDENLMYPCPTLLA